MRGRGREGRSRSTPELTWFALFLLDSGDSGYLKDQDIFTLSPTQRAAPAFTKFSATPARSLLIKLIKSNGRDLFFDALLTTIAVIFI